MIWIEICGGGENFFAKKLSPPPHPLLFQKNLNFKCAGIENAEKICYNYNVVKIIEFRLRNERNQKLN